MANTYGPNANSPGDNTLAALQRVSLSVAFDTSRTDSASTNTGSTLLANYQQLSQVTMRLILINDRDPLAPKNWKKIRDLSVSTPSLYVANRGRELMGPLTSVQEYPFPESEKCKLEAAAFDKALCKAMDVFDQLNSENPDQNELKSAFAIYIEEIQKLTISVPNWQQRVNTYALARFSLDERHKQLYKQIAKAPSLTFEYDLNRPPAVSAAASSTTTAPVSPDLSAAGLVYVASLLES